MNKRLSLVLGLGLVVQSQALLVEQFTDNQIDSVPGLAVEDTAGFLYTYKDSKSFVYKQTTTVPVTATVLAAAATYQTGGGLALTFKTGATATNYYPYAGLGFDWKKAGGTTAAPIKYPVDLSADSTIIIKYTSNTKVIMEWAQVDDPNPDDGSAFFCVLPVKTTLGTHTCKLAGVDDSTKGFKQPFWVTDARTFDPTTAVSLKFVVKTAGTTSNFTIRAIYVNDTTQGWPEVSSSSGVVLSSSSAVVVVSSSSVIASSSSSATATSNVVWIPSLVNQIQLNDVAGGFWYGYAGGATDAAFAPADFTTVTTDIPAILNPGTTAGGFAAVGFDWLDNGDPAPDPKGAADISAKSSLCLNYTADTTLLMVLKQQDVADSCPQMVLTIPAATTATTAAFSLAGFKKENWTKAGCTVTAPNIKKQTGVHFQNKSTRIVNLTLTAVGFNDICGTPTIKIGFSSSSVKVSSSSVKVSSSSVKVSSSSVASLSSSSVVTTSSSSGASAVCMSVLSGHTQVWMLEDDDANGVVNYNEPAHPCYMNSSIVLGVKPDAGFGFLNITNSEISFRTYENGMAKVEVFGLDGRLMATVFQGQIKEGVHKTHWKGTSMREGVYLFRLTQGSQSRQVKAVLTR